MGRLRRVALGALAGIALALGVAAVQPSTAAAASSHCGWTGCSVYLNKTETRYIGYGGAVASSYLGRVPRYGPALAALGSFIPAWANYATSHGWCLAVYKPYVTSTFVPYPYHC
jgi:hypothetical protein